MKCDGRGRTTYGGNEDVKISKTSNPSASLKMKYNAVAATNLKLKKNVETLMEDLFRVKNEKKELKHEIKLLKQKLELIKAIV